MDAFYIIPNYIKESCAEYAGKIQSYLLSKGKKCTVQPPCGEENRNSRSYTDISQVPSGTEAVLVLGGDGTMLRAGKLGAPVGVPVRGVNFGHFGFLMETQRDEWHTRLDDLLSGNWEIDRRMMIYAELYRDGKKLHSWEALNDIVIARAMSLRPIHLFVHVNEIELAEYVAAGLIRSTAPRSTS